ncbi:uncharacterized protein LOC135209119 isoform X2 [Macrobrachium nipponense]|uniref:uncharacterized protein LOC135209119 isoform X2 n=1 Tax=Macrobrachium nipponense TaxID=159736 RepID=UPI0030C88DD8
MEEIGSQCARLRVDPSVMTSRILLLLLMAMAAPLVYGAPMPMPSESDSPSTDSRNSLGMLVITPRAPGLARAIFLTDDSDSDDAFTLLFSRGIMAEMAPSVENRGLLFSPDPNIIVVRGCRGNYQEDPSGACRQIFAFPSYPPRTPRPRIPSASRFPRPRVVPQTQRDLVKRFNTSRRQNTWLGRSLSSGSDERDSSSSSPSSRSSSSSSSEPYEDNAPTGLPFIHSTTPATTTTTLSTTTPDCDD